jgi:hypothetical protein
MEKGRRDSLYLLMEARNRHCLPQLIALQELQ